VLDERIEDTEHGVLVELGPLGDVLLRELGLGGLRKRVQNVQGLSKDLDIVCSGSQGHPGRII
jgi:hypothetical protein